MNPSVYVSIAAAAIALASLIYNVIRAFGDTHVRRAQFFKEIVDKLRFDEELVDAMTILDYDVDWYNDKFPKSKTEMKMDKLFSYLTYICYLCNNKIISKKEFALIEYKIKRACQNEDAQAYLKFINRFSKMNNIKKHAYHELIEYLKTDVYNNDPALIDEFDNGNKFKIARDYFVLKIKKDD